MSELEDKDLMALLKSVDPKENDRGFRFMYRHYHGMIQGLILNNKGNEREAEDVFQDALIVLYNQIRKSDFELRCTVKTYLYSICRNLWLKKLRKQKREVALDDSIKEIVDIDESSLRTLEVTEEKSIVASYLNQLSSGCQKILKYFYFERKKMAEIASLLGLANEQGAKNKKSVCMKKLKSLMKDSKYFKQY